MTQKLFHTFDINTGEIRGSYAFSQTKAGDIDLNTGAGETWLEVSQHGRGGTHYIDLTDPQNPVVADRPVWNPFPATGAAPLVVDITDAPAGTSLTVADDGGEVTTVSDFTQPLTFVDTGGYTVNIAPPFPYQAITQKVTAT